MVRKKEVKRLINKKKAPNTKTLGMRIKYFRNKQKGKKLTQEEAAKLVGCSLKTWYRWESGKSIPMQHYRDRLLQLLPALKTI